MEYNKPVLTLEEQASLLMERGLQAVKGELTKRLAVVNYYRLSSYLCPFRERDSATGKLGERFVAGTSLNIVWRRYNFDRRLRIILLDAIERIEVSVRTRLVYHFVQKYGAFGHLSHSALPGFREQGDYQRWFCKLLAEQQRSREIFVEKFREKYGDCHDSLPLWMAAEIMTCATTLRFAYGVEPEVLKRAAMDFSFPDQQLISWSKAVFTLRNACAHHARVWDRIIRVKPAYPQKNKNPDWHQSPVFPNDRVGLMLTICYHWLGKISTTTKWKQRLFALFDEYPEIPLSQMGIPQDWRNHPLWR